MNTSEPKEQFVQAAQKGDVSYIEKHIYQVDGKTLIKAFVYTPSVEISKLLYSYGVNIDAQDKGEEGFSIYSSLWAYPALAVSCKENYTERALWLIQQGANVNACWSVVFARGIKYCLTPLMWSVKNKNLLLIQSLITAQADVNYLGYDDDAKRATAFSLAKKYSPNEYIEIRNILKSAGAKE